MGRSILTRLVLLVLILTPIQAYALSLPLLGGKTTASACSPCTGTYLFCWTGEYLGDTDTACYNSGAGTKAGTVTGATIGGGYAYTGSYGVQLNAGDESVCYAITAKDIIDTDTTGTIWLDIRIASGESNNRIIEVWQGTANNILCRIGTADKPAIVHEGDNSAIERIATNALSYETWYTIGFSWSVAGDVVSVKRGADAWDETSGAVTAFTAQPANFCIGEVDSGDITDEIWIDNVYILSGYQTAHP